MYETEIAAGAAWLDEVEPGWATYINLADFDIRSGYNCVIGQVLRYVTYDEGANFYDAVSESRVPRRLGMTYHEARDRGFHGDNDINWDALQTEWLAFLAERQVVA